MLELSRLNIPILPSDINFSNEGFTVENKNDVLSIRSGLANIKNIGSDLAKFIVKERLNNGKYETIFSFFTRMNDKFINKRQVEFLAMAGVFDGVFKDRSAIFNSAAKLVALSQDSQKDRDSFQQGLFGNELNSQNFTNILKEAIPWSKRELLINEYLSLLFFTSKIPLLEKRPFFKKFNLSNSLTLENNKVNGKMFELIAFFGQVRRKGNK